jgi:hypothetical protein
MNRSIGRARAALLVCVLAGLSGLAGCGGGGPTITCGEGTVERDGRCVLVEEPILCGAGTRLDEMMRRCVLEDDPVTCGPGTVLDMASGRCVPESMITCGAGTRAMGETCVPDGSVICTGNTRFDMASGTCVIDPMACADGTVLVDGACVPFDDTLMADVPAAAEPDDPRDPFGGTPTAFTPPALGEDVTLGGCITPADFDMDGATDVDADWFNFTVSGPGLYEIRADGVGGLSAAFAVLSSEADFAYTRVGIDLTSDGASRQIYLPRAGAYWLAIFDSRSLALDSLATQLAFAPRPVGDADTCYFVTVERLATPAPTPIAGVRTTATFPTDGSIAFYSTTTTARTVVLASENSEPDTIQEAVVVLEGDAISGQAGAAAQFATAFSGILESGTTAVVVADFVYNYGLAPTTFTLDVSQLPEATGAAMLDHSTDVYRWAWFEGTAGDVVHLEATPSVGNLDFAVIDPAFTQFVSNRCTAGRTCAAFDGFLQLEQTGRYMIRMFDTAATLSEGSPYTVTFATASQTPAPLTLGTAAPTTLADRWTFVELEGDSLQWLSFELSAFSGFAAADLRFYPRAGTGAFGELDSLVAPVESADDVAVRLGRIYAGTGDDMLIAIGYGADPAAGDAVTLTAREAPAANIMATPGTPIVRGAEVATTGTLWYLVRGDVGVSVTFRVTSGAGTITQLSRTESTLATAAAPGSLSATLGAAGWVAFAVTGTAGTTYAVTVDSQLPPYAVGAGMRRFADVCAVAGSRTLLTAADDTLSAAQTVAGLPSGSFNFYGAAQTRYIVSSNGWMTFDGAYAGSTFLPGAGLGDARAPNRLVVPAFDDLVTSVCVRETPAELIVQWTGQVYGVATEVIEMQAILYADGRIELVYGDGHTAPSAGATFSGIEDGTGNALTTGGRVMAGTSVLFTPR